MEVFDVWSIASYIYVLWMIAKLVLCACHHIVAPCLLVELASMRSCYMLHEGC